MRRRARPPRRPASCGRRRSAAAPGPARASGARSPEKTRSVESATRRRPRSRQALGEPARQRAFVAAASSGRSWQRSDLAERRGVDDAPPGARRPAAARARRRRRASTRSARGPGRRSGAPVARPGPRSPRSCRSAASRPAEEAAGAGHQHAHALGEHDRAAVHGQDLAVEVAGEVGGQERDRPGDLLRRARPAERDGRGRRRPPASTRASRGPCRSSPSPAPRS